MPPVPSIVDLIFSCRAALSPDRALLVGLSGIDGSGKGYVADRLESALIERHLKTAMLHVDGWLNLPEIRFDIARPAENFYENALRLDELFTRLVAPLQTSRWARLTMDWVEETATASRPFTYDFGDVDVIVLEGIFLFKQSYRKLFDLAVWVDCSWETALERALERAQEGLPPGETVHAYRTIYFPAEEIHFKRDAPRESADLIFQNDPHLAERGAAGA